MVAKLVTWAEDRESCRRRMLRALDELILQGPPTTIPFHQAALQHPDFVSAHVTTGFVSRLNLTGLPGAQRSLPDSASLVIDVGNASLDGRALKDSRTFQVRVEGKPYTVEVAELIVAASKTGRADRKRDHAGPAGGAVVSPMHGVVIRVPVEPGTTVTRGTVICVIEAMKMENEILAPNDGIVTDVFVAAGETVDVGAKLLCVQADG
jgi:acetyl-CoA/propionyl-CoA carboxylase biotin carboxyl carrier protein